jgi:hypothetical protein
MNENTPHANSGTEQESDQQRKRQKLEQAVVCQECGAVRSVEDIINHQSRTCLSCGNTISPPGCSVCGGRIQRYDDKRGDLVCWTHFIEHCAGCGELITDGNKVKSSRAYGSYHPKCTPSHRRFVFRTVIAALVILTVLLISAGLIASHAWYANSPKDRQTTSP